MVSSRAVGKSRPPTVRNCNGTSLAIPTREDENAITGSDSIVRTCRVLDIKLSLGASRVRELRVGSAVDGKAEEGLVGTGG